MLRGSFKSLNAQSIIEVLFGHRGGKGRELRSYSLLVDEAKDSFLEC